LNFLLHFIFLATFTFLYVISIIILRPLRIHKKRPISTITLKVSYLLYLLVFLVLAYLVLFYSRVRAEAEETSAEGSYTIYYIIVIVAFLVPNLGIMLRRKVIKMRAEYNIIFTVINMIVIMVLSFILYTIPWEW
jgi:hypothetical protein